MSQRAAHSPAATDAIQILDRLTGDTPAMRALIEEERTGLRVAKQIVELRTKAKLSQAQLAERVRTTQSVISRLEDADYRGHSLAMLQRIATALHQRVELRFVPDIPSRRKAPLNA